MEKKEYSFWLGCKAMLFTGPLNILLFTVPFAFISYVSKWPDPVTFSLSLLAIAPFAERLGFVTEQLALHTNQTIGGLLNATFGNATELIVSLAALSKGLFRVVQLSLLGSILSNLLLVLGSAFFFGGLKHKTQRFGKISSQINSTLLMLSCMGLMFPTLLSNSSEETILNEVEFSRAISVILLLLYFAYLYFQLKTHRTAYEEDDSAAPPKQKSKGVSVKSANSKESEEEEEVVRFRGNDKVGGGLSSGKADEKSQAKDTEAAEKQLIPRTDSSDPEEEEEEEEEEEDILGFNYSIVWLAIITVFIAFLSEALVDSIQSTAKKISGFFLAAIVLPIVGNAAEHASAVIFAMRGKLDLALGVAVGSSTQVLRCVDVYMN